MDFRDVVIETERLRLVPISPEFRQNIFESFTEKVARYTFPQPTGDIADTDSFISKSSKSVQNGEELQVVVVLKETGEFIGCAGLHHLDSEPELGLWLKESVWKQGFGLELIQGLKKWADETITYEYLYYPVKSDNIGSRRIAEKMGGLLQVGEFISENARGESYPMVAYRIYP